ncbi:YihY/virulence factor BrkB family protein [Nanchangia anserum]|uniref:YihY/virulence factor BrkB family protein n=1 Tax=Nanchangia anserum TaxID=2692125 RepID=A0A8I0GDT9_9ACTO|nr:YihY/virulence factor BrkB family protein [Nanchangia anserum]MBD3690131.1 YihY/virulence factor BrkB family protein [Nanchangia anserum]QOX82087.1 YihY/virulence factor BrkB family protein [Nanchangia anserum]
MNSSPKQVADPVGSTYPEATPSLRSVADFPTLGGKIKAITDWAMSLRVLRAFTRYSGNRGNLLAGGISYTALFSLASALTIGITITFRILGSRPDLMDAVFRAVNDTVPSLLSWNGTEGLVDPTTMIESTNVLSIAGIIAVVTLLFSASAVMTAIKNSLRLMFGIHVVPDNPVFDKLRDLAGFAFMLLGVLVTAVVSTVNSTIGPAILEPLGIGSTVATRIVGTTTVVLAALVDAIVLVVMVRVVSRIRPMRRDLLMGAGIFVVGSGILRLVGTSAVSAVDSPLLAPFAAIITIMLWVNLLARVVLLTAAFIANPPQPAKPNDADHLHANETPNYVTLSDRSTLAWPHLSLTGSVDLDPETDPNRIDDDAEDTERFSGRGPVKMFLRRRLRHHERKAAHLRNVLRTR